MKCPFCGFKQFMYLSVEFKRCRPEGGDYNICANCQEISIVDAGLFLRHMTDDEAVAVAGNKSLLRAQAALRQLKRKS